MKAEDYAATHTIILKNKTIFRTISNMWKKQESSSGNYMMIVSSKLLKVDSTEGGMYEDGKVLKFNPSAEKL